MITKSFCKGFDIVDLICEGENSKLLFLVNIYIPTDIYCSIRNRVV